MSSLLRIPHNNQASTSTCKDGYICVATTPSSRASSSRSEWAESGGSSSADRRMVATADCRMMSSVAPWEPLKWIFIILYLAIAGLSNWAVLAYTHDFVPREPLPDILFSIFPEQDWAARWGDLMVTSCVVCLAILIFLHQQRIVVVRRVLFIAATLYAMRSCTLMVTQLPSGYKNNSAICREPLEKGSAGVFFSRLWEQTIRLGFQGKEDILCGDLLFSGHTLVMILCSLSVTYYLPRTYHLLKWIPCLCAMFGMLCMIISRTHYTIDIVVAYWLANFVFRIYHSYCEVDIYVERRQSVLHDLWLCRVIGWLEESIVPGKIENKFSVPFSKYLRGAGHHKQISISSSSTFNPA